MLFFITHIPKLGSDEINPDAINWHQRSEQYVDAIKSKDFLRTYQHYHPGVTLMFLTGVPVELLKRAQPERVEYSRFSYEAFHTVAKLSINSVILVLIIYLIFNLTKIVGFNKAFFVGVLLVIDPFFLGNTRLLHMDALLSVFLANALTAFYLGVKRKSILYLMFGSVLLGFSFWTKNIAILAVLYALGWILLVTLFQKLGRRFLLKGIVLIVLGFFLAGYSILPALWVNPKRVFTKIINGSALVVNEGHEEVFLGEITNDPGPFYYPLVLLFKLSPFVLILSIGSLVYFTLILIREKKFLSSQHLFVYYLVLFALGYFVAIEVANKKIDRYLLPLFPLFYVFVSVFIFDLLARTNKTYLYITVFFAFALFSAWDLRKYFPYYFVYNSYLFGGAERAGKLIGQKSFGIGVFEVKDFIVNNYGMVKVGFVDRKPIAAIYPNSLVFDVRAYGPTNYDILVLDSDESMPKKALGKFVLDKSIKIGGVNFWNFYVKIPQE